jgi:hypothetical protein
LSKLKEQRDFFIARSTKMQKNAYINSKMLSAYEKGTLRISSFLCEPKTTRKNIIIALDFTPKAKR